MSLSKIVHNVTGKAVAIIGGADVPNILDSVRHWDAIIWTNNHWLKHGGRIDGLFHCCGPRAPAEAIIEKLLLDSPVYLDCIVGPSWGVGAKHFRQYCGETGTPGLFLGQDITTIAYYRSLEAELNALGGSAPFTGLVAAHFFHCMPVTRIGLFGMDLYVNQDQNAMIEAHNPRAHAAMFDRLQTLDPRFVFCDSLSESIDLLLQGATG